MALEKYREKRTADRTPEPFGTSSPQTEAVSEGMFVVQQHSARQLHFDFRLAMEGVLRSWAVPKGPSLNPDDKRLAVMVEDHPLEYANFEGVIPQGNYGAGAVIVWDRGAYRALDPPGDPTQSIHDGKLDLELRGFKLRGAYTLVRTRGMQSRGRADSKPQWLLIKKRDQFAEPIDVLAAHPRSVLSGLTVDEMRDAAAAGGEITRELAADRTPGLRSPLTAKTFPLNLAKLTEHPFDGDEWLFELKFDGVRVLAIRDGESIKLHGRNGREITDRYPEVALALRAMPFERFVFDGEIVVPDERGYPSFQLLQKRINVERSAEIAHLALAMPVNYWVFDLLAFDHFDLRTLPLERRKALLARLIRGEGPVRYCDHVIGRGRDCYAGAAAAQLEGIIAKRRHAPYRGTRSADWLKIKCPRTGLFVIGGWTDPEGSRDHFGALLIGLHESDGALRFIARVGSGFADAELGEIATSLQGLARAESPFRGAREDEPQPPRGSHFCAPQMVCEVQFTEWTEGGGIRHPTFQRMVEDLSPANCVYPSADAEPRAVNDATEAFVAVERTAGRGTSEEVKMTKDRPRGSTIRDRHPTLPARTFTPTHAEKVFWPEGYTKGDLINYYTVIAPWMLPYLKDRPVVLTRYPDGISGKSFFQKDAPAFAPAWIRTERIYSPDAHRDISYFILESAEALAYMANLGAIPIHIWASRIAHLERPDWLLFDLDPKNSTTQMAVVTARAVAAVLKEVGLRPYLKTSGQMGLHVLVGILPQYTYEQARMFAELVAQITVRRIPETATLTREVALRGGRTYIDYLQLGQGKTIAAPYAVRPVPRAPVSAPLKWTDLKPALDPGVYTIKTMPTRMARLKRDPFAGVLSDQQRLEQALPRLEKLLHETPTAPSRRRRQPDVT